VWYNAELARGLGVVEPGANLTGALVGRIMFSWPLKNKACIGCFKVFNFKKGQLGKSFSSNQNSSLYFQTYLNGIENNIRLIVVFK
jgi:hypothetical protein